MIDSQVGRPWSKPCFQAALVKAHHDIEDHGGHEEGTTKSLGNDLQKKKKKTKIKRKNKIHDKITFFPKRSG